MTARSATVILPAHDEAGTIEDVVRRCRTAVPGLLEVIVVDDGSTDGTGGLAERAGARVITLSPNRGKGIALRSGLAEARGDVIVLLDADGQDAPEDIPLLLEALTDGVTMVVGSRFLGTFDLGAITLINRAGNRALTEVLNALYGMRLTDTQAGFRAFHRRFLDGIRLSATRYDIEVDLLLSAVESGGSVLEVPVRRMARTYGSTDLGSFRDGARILSRIVRRRLTAPRQPRGTRVEPR
jgi:glycosyltransferase involved in cell wall biosynthesis